MTLGAGGASEPVRLTLVSRAGCHLCDLARPIVAAVAADTACALDELDFDRDPGLPAEYGDLLPVILVDGVVHDTWRVDERRLRAAIAARRAGDGTTRWWRRITRGW